MSAIGFAAADVGGRWAESTRTSLPRRAPLDDARRAGATCFGRASPHLSLLTATPIRPPFHHTSLKLKQSLVFKTAALSPPMSAGRLSGVAGTFSDDSIGGLGSMFGAQLRKGSRSAPWEEEAEADAASLDQQSDAGNTEGDHEAGWAALGLTHVDSVERRDSGHTRLYVYSPDLLPRQLDPAADARVHRSSRSPPTTMYLRPISAREQQFGQPRTPHSTSLAAAMYAFPTPPDEGDSSSSIPSYYSPAVNTLGRRHGLPSPSPSPKHFSSATPTKSPAARKRAPLSDVGNLRSSGFSNDSRGPPGLTGAAQSSSTVQHKSGVVPGRAGPASRDHPALPSPLAHETAPQRVIRAKKSLLKMFSKASSVSSSASPIPTTSTAKATTLVSAAHYQKTSSGRFPLPEPAAEAYSFLAPMTELSVRGCGESEFVASPSPSVISLSVEAPSRPPTPPAPGPTTPSPRTVAASATDASFESTLSTLSTATASPAPVKPLKLRPISRAWTASLPTDFLSLPQTSPDPSTLLSPGSLHSSLSSPSASSFATSGWSNASSVVGSEASTSASVLGDDKDAAIRRLEQELCEAALAWHTERLEYQVRFSDLLLPACRQTCELTDIALAQAEIRDLKATLTDREIQFLVRVTTAPLSATDKVSLSGAAVAEAVPDDVPAESVPVKTSIMDRGRVKTGGGRATFGRGDLRT